MIRTVWPILAIMLLAAGIFPALQGRFGRRFPPCCRSSHIAPHASLSAFGARPLHFGLLPLDLFLCGIASLVHIGGVAAAPLLAARYRPSQVPAGMLLALPGHGLAPACACW